MVGAPLAMLERLVDTDHFTRAVEGLSRYLGHGFDAVMGCEIGCLNAMIPVLVAGKLGLPLIDADTLGRSFPQVNMSTFAINGETMTPMVMSDIRDNEIVIARAADPDWTETLVRAGATALALPPSARNGWRGRAESASRSGCACPARCAKACSAGSIPTVRCCSIRGPVANASPRVRSFPRSLREER